MKNNGFLYVGAAVLIAAIGFFGMRLWHDRLDGHGGSGDSGQTDLPQTGSGFIRVAGGPVSQALIKLDMPDALSPPCPVEGMGPMRVIRMGDAENLPIGAEAILSGASGEGLLYVGPEKYNDRWAETAEKEEGHRAAYADFFAHNDSPYPGFAQYAFQAPAAGEYEIWLRVYWVDDCGNSVSLSIDDGPLHVATHSTVGEWMWMRLMTGERRPRLFTLEEGEHRLVLHNREDDCYLDRVLLRDARARAPAPVGPMNALENTP